MSEYSQREMRLMHERDAALSRAEASDAEVSRLRECVAAQEVCITKLENQRRWSLPPAWLTDELSFIDRCVRDEALHTLAERARALARRLASEGTATKSPLAGPGSFEIKLPARCTVLVHQSEQYPGEWIVKTNIITRDVETGEQGMFGATRYFVPAKGRTKARRPSMRQVARAVFDSLRHEVDEQLGLNPHKTGVRK